MKLNSAASRYAQGPEAVVNALPLPVVVIAPDGKIIDANSAAESFFEVSVPLLKRHLLRELIPFGSPLLSLPRRRNRSTGRRRAFDVRR